MSEKIKEHSTLTFINDENTSLEIRRNPDIERQQKNESDNNETENKPT